MIKKLWKTSLYKLGITLIRNLLFLLGFVNSGKGPITQESLALLAPTTEPLPSQLSEFYAVWIEEKMLWTCATIRTDVGAVQERSR